MNLKMLNLVGPNANNPDYIGTNTSCPLQITQNEASSLLNEEQELFFLVLAPA